MIGPIIANRGPTAKLPKTVAKVTPKKRKPFCSHKHAKKAEAFAWAMNGVEVLHFASNIREYAWAGVGAIALSVAMFFTLRR